MKIENRLVYIAEDGTEFDSADACKQHEAANALGAFLSKQCLEYHYDYAEFIVQNFAKIKEIVEG